MSIALWIGFYMLLFLVAFLYASVGHGGASGYIALMTLFNFVPEEIKIIALGLNILVSGIAFIQYYSVEKINYTLAIPLLISSIPLAFIGGGMKIDTSIYKIILAIILVIPIIRLTGIFQEKEKQIQTPSIFILVIIGAVIGFLSGLIGIGGGILLTPLLIYFSWSSMKQASLLSALFIFLNSIAGLIAKKSIPSTSETTFFIMAGIVVIAGFLGAYLGAKIFKSIVLKRILASVLIIAVIKLISTL
ncbi:MAG: sulfite exporter TauE/SafE family protein [Bacteroidota bacterium]